MSTEKLAYVDDEGDLVVQNVNGSTTLVPLNRVKSAEDIVRQLWRLSTKDNHENDAIKQTIEIMAKKVGLMGPGGDWVNNG